LFLKTLLRNSFRWSFKAFFSLLFFIFLLAGAFLAAVAGISAMAGFGRTVMGAKKKDPQFFQKGVTGSIEMADTGANLALRALGWGTVFAFLGTGTICFGIWKLSGANNVSIVC
jgi:hypothetical protein